MASYTIGQGSKRYKTLKEAQIAAIKYVRINRTAKRGTFAIPIYNADSGKEIGEIVGMNESYGGRISKTNFFWSPEGRGYASTILPDGTIVKGGYANAPGNPRATKMSSSAFLSGTLEMAVDWIRRHYANVVYVFYYEGRTEKSYKEKLIGQVIITEKGPLFILDVAHYGTAPGTYHINSNGTLGRRV